MQGDHERTLPRRPILIGVAWRTTLALVAVALVLGGCGGSGDEEGMRATLTDDGCAFEGSTGLRAGRFDIAVANETRLFSAFFLAAVAGDATADDVQETVDGLPRRFRKSGESPARTPWRNVVGSAAEPAATSIIPADVRAGTYVVLCIVGRPTDTRQSSRDPVLPQAI